MSQFDVILADAPWPFRVWNRDTGQGRSAESHYHTMTLAEICALPVRAIAAPNCALFLWGVWPSIFDTQTVMEAWGFKYKTKAWSWVKANKSGMGFFFGMGYYTRANDEPCLLAVRGNMPVASRSVRAIIYSPVRAHSQKPDEQYNKIETLYPGRRYIELFARNTRPNWISVGNEINGKDITTALKELANAQ